MAGKPLFGMLLSLIGGLIMLVVGVLAAMNIITGNFLLGSSALFGGLNLLGYGGVFAFIFGILIVVFSILMYMKPKNKMYWGLLIVIFAVLNILLGYDVLFIGSILALIGGLIGWFMGK
jgi:hypothetical protein